MTKKRLIGIVLICGFLAYLIAGHLYARQIEARMSSAQQEFFTWLQQAGTDNDFLPSNQADGWTYFYVPDQRSIYRIQSNSVQPELVCEDCDGDVQVSDDTLFFLRCGKSSLKGEWISADLDGSNQKVLNARLFTGIEDWSRTVTGNFLLVYGYSQTALVPLDTRRAETITLTIGEAQVETLLWTDGSVLYFSTASESSVETRSILWRYYFDGEPEPMGIPDTYIYSNHIGNQVFFYDRDEKNVYCLSLPDETWSKLGDGAYPVYPMSDGEYLDCSGDQIERISNTQGQKDTVIRQNDGQVYCGLLEISDDHLICWYREYHDDFNTCGCTDANYMHYYIRTELINWKTGRVLWTSDGDSYILIQ